MEYPYRQKIPQGIKTVTYTSTPVPICEVINGKRQIVEYSHTMYWIKGKTFDHKDELKKHGAMWNQKEKCWTCFEDDFKKMFLPELPKNVCCRDVVSEKDGTLRCTIGENGCPMKIQMEKEANAAKELAEVRKSMYKLTYTIYEYSSRYGHDDFNYERYFNTREELDAFEKTLPFGVRNRYGDEKNTGNIEITEPEVKIVAET